MNRGQHAKLPTAICTSTPSPARRSTAPRPATHRENPQADPRTSPAPNNAAAQKQTPEQIPIHPDKRSRPPISSSPHRSTEPGHPTRKERNPGAPQERNSQDDKRREISAPGPHPREGRQERATPTSGTPTMRGAGARREADGSEGRRRTDRGQAPGYRAQDAAGRSRRREDGAQGEGKDEGRKAAGGEQAKPDGE